MSFKQKFRRQSSSKKRIFRRKSNELVEPYFTLVQKLMIEVSNDFAVDSKYRMFSIRFVVSDRLFLSPNNYTLTSSTMGILIYISIVKIFLVSNLSRERCPIQGIGLIQGKYERFAATVIMHDFFHFLCFDPK